MSTKKNAIVAINWLQSVSPILLYCLSFNPTKSAHCHNGTIRRTLAGFLFYLHVSVQGSALFHKSLPIRNWDYQQYQSHLDSSISSIYAVTLAGGRSSHKPNNSFRKHFFHYCPYLFSSCNSSVNR